MRLLAYEKGYLFKQDLNRDNLSQYPISMEGTTLDIIDSPSKIDELISNGFIIDDCPFLEMVKKQLGQETVLFFLFDGKNLAHTSMVSTDYYFAKSLEIAFGQKGIGFDKAGYIGPCYTKPDYRGRGFYPFVLSKICEFLAKNGKKEALITSKDFHHASLKGIKKASFKPIARVRYLTLPFVRTCKIKAIENEE